MPIGLRVTKNLLDEWAGGTALNIKAALGLVRDLKDFLDTQTNQDLVALGYTAEEATTLKTAADDMLLLFRLFQGNQALPVAKDFRTEIRKLWGIGVPRTTL